MGVHHTSRRHHTQQMAQGYYRNFRTGEEKADGETLLGYLSPKSSTRTTRSLWKPACGESHELPDRPQMGREKTALDNIAPPDAMMVIRRDLHEPRKDADGEKERIWAP
jgi:hypothetical protein